MNRQQRRTMDRRRDVRRRDRSGRDRSRDRSRQSRMIPSPDRYREEPPLIRREPELPRSFDSYDMRAREEYENIVPKQRALEMLPNSQDYYERFSEAPQERNVVWHEPENYNSDRFAVSEEPTRDNGRAFENEFQYNESRSKGWQSPKDERSSQEFLHQFNNRNVDDSTKRQDFPHSERISSIDIPDFDPENTALTARQWLCIIEKHATKHNWGLDEKKYYLSSRLKGFARQWFISYKGENTWNSIRKAFIHLFPSDMEYHDQLQAMFTRRKKPEESMSSYFNDKVALLNSCGITGSKAVSCIIAGSTSNKVLKEELYNLNFNNVDSLFEHVNKSPDFKKVDVKIPQSKESEPKCYKCNEIGHVRKFCPLKNVPQFSDAHPTIPDERLPVQEELPEVPLDKKFFTPLRLHGRSFEAYVDYKCEHVTIREEVAHVINLEYRKCFQFIKAFDGRSIPAIGETLTYIQVGDASPIDIEIYMVANHHQPVPIIIGQRFIKHPRIRVFEKDKGIQFLDAKI